MSKVRQTGKCKWFDRKKGYGFVEVDGGGGDVFVHQSQLRIDGFRALQPEQSVEFLVLPSGPNNRPCATEVSGVNGDVLTAGPPLFRRRRGGRGRGRGGSSGSEGRGSGQPVDTNAAPAPAPADGADTGRGRGRGRGGRGRGGRGRGGRGRGGREGEAPRPRAPLNCAFVFIKPHAVTEEVKKFVKSKLEESGLRILNEGSLASEEIDKKKLIDQHYYAIASKATILKPNQLAVPADQFKEKFGVSWEDALKKGNVYNAMDGCQNLGVDANKMDELWAQCKKNNNLVKFGGGFYCGKIEGVKGKEPIYVFNGFFMSMRSKFTQPGGSIHYYVVQWPRSRLTWKDFRGKLLGPTDPAEAPADSLRGQILARYQELGLKSQPNTGDNGVHASASPFEGLGERLNWLGVSLEEDPYGKVLLEAGINDTTIHDWTRDPQVTLPDGTKGSLFDALEDLDARDCLDLCKKIAGV